MANDGVGGTAAGAAGDAAGDAAGEYAPVGVAHDGEMWAERFKPHVWRPSRVRVPQAGTWVGEKPPEKIIVRPYVQCSYCGSITVGRFLDALATPGTHYSGSDWKYGWPHKFYVEIPCEPFETFVTSSSYVNGDGRTVEHVVHDSRTLEYNKFYCVHLLDASDAELARWAEVATPLLGVHFYRDSTGRVMWKSLPGFQTFGTVGGVGDVDVGVTDAGRQ